MLRQAPSESCRRSENGRRPSLPFRPPRAAPLLTVGLLLVAVAGLSAQEGPADGAAADPEAEAAWEFVDAAIQERRGEYVSVATEIWGLAELGYQEEESSALLQSQLREAGFEVETGVAGIPTAFIGSWGTDGPVIGILAEFDALPGVSQDSVPFRRPREEVTSGHACGHHLFGTASVAAAIAVKEWLESSGTAGTVRLYGTPAEEGGAGKVYMARAGLFDDVDGVLHWHPGDENSAGAQTSLANKSAKFRFRGAASHAAGAPDRGRSALDGVEAMNDMVNMMREHVPDETRIHYVITSGGEAPNVVPEFAEVFYYVRNRRAPVANELFERVVNAAEGAALGTGTEVEYEVIHGIYDLVPNETLSRFMDANLRRVGGVEYTEEELAFAERLRETLPGELPPLASASEIQPFGIDEGSASTDVGDVSWLVPTAGLGTATWVPGTSAHTWQAVAAGGTGIGMKGMMNAARILARTATDLYRQPDVLVEARRELEERRGTDFVYQPLLGDRDPPLDYRQ